MQKRDGIVLREIHGLYYLIDSKSNYSDDKCYLYEINEVGAFLWEHMEGAGSSEELADLLYDQIVGEVDREAVRTDVREYLEMLQAEGFMQA